MPFDAEITQKSRDLIVLEKAREKVAKGWCQNAIMRDGAVCALGAFTTQENIPYSWVKLNKALGFDDWQKVVRWNNAEGRTQAEVLARFDEAIARLAGQS